MNIEEIRKGAPSGAEYYDNFCRYYKKVDGDLYWFYSEKWWLILLPCRIKPLF